MDKYPKCTIEADVWLLECDGNTLSCAINTTSLALVYAGIEMIDFITCSQAIIINKIDKNTNKNKNDNQNQITLLNATLSEERYVNKECEIIVSFMNQKKQITLLNMNGSLSSEKTKETLQVCLKMVLKVLNNFFNITYYYLLWLYLQHFFGLLFFASVLFFASCANF